mmetsp:Transcript_48781/g.116103  ORF Transcript_48781/g.116103 Transcript_48781/m.116103 type:complete len:286 (+) Transcript_48781:1432-2289(+)
MGPSSASAGRNRRDIRQHRNSAMHGLQRHTAGRGLAGILHGCGWHVARGLDDCSHNPHDMCGKRSVPRADLRREAQLHRRHVVPLVGRCRRGVATALCHSPPCGRGHRYGQHRRGGHRRAHDRDDLRSSEPRVCHDPAVPGARKQRLPQAQPLRVGHRPQRDVLPDRDGQRRGLPVPLPPALRYRRGERHNSGAALALQLTHVPRPRARRFPPVRRNELLELPGPLRVLALHDWLRSHPQGVRCGLGRDSEHRGRLDLLSRRLLRHAPGGVSARLPGRERRRRER